MYPIHSLHVVTIVNCTHVRSISASFLKFVLVINVSYKYIFFAKKKKFTVASNFWAMAARDMSCHSPWLADIYPLRILIIPLYLRSYDARSETSRCSRLTKRCSRMLIIFIEIDRAVFEIAPPTGCAYLSPPPSFSSSV
jgi:hypothetical protein